METLEQTKQAPDMQKVEQFAGQVLSDLAANYAGVLILVGYELGLYKAMSNAGPLTTAELAQKTGTYERYIREWLNGQAAGGYVNYYPEDRTYELPAENAMVLAQKDSPVLMTPGFLVVNSLWQDKNLLLNAFKTGQGIGWHEHHHDLFHGVEGIFKAGYVANLNDVWIPSLEGMSDKLVQGATVADVGCGHGASTILMAERFPNSKFYGSDYHSESIEVAKKRAEEKGLFNVHFEHASADEFKEGNYDLICFFDCFHDFGNPLKAMNYAKQQLAKNGSLMIVEPNAGNNPEDNFNLIGRLAYSASTSLCVPHSHSQEGDYCLGGQAGPAITEDIAREAGFSWFRIAHKSVLNIIYEVKA
jgi:SAM-dependent methyltransferase